MDRQIDWQTDDGQSDPYQKLKDLDTAIMAMVGMAVVEWLSSWLAKQEVQGSIPGLTTLISETGHLLLPSRDMAEMSKAT